MSGNTDRLLEKIKAALGQKNSVSEEERSDSIRLVEKLKSMDSEYRQKTALPAVDISSVPKTLGLTPKTVSEKSDEELVKEAEPALAAAYAKNVAKLENSTEGAINKLADNKTSAAEEYAEDEAALAKKAVTLSEDHKNDMILQGLLYSSINANGKSDIETDFLTRSAAAKAAYESKAAEIEAKISLVRLDFEQALSQYDLQYAADLESKISSLKLSQEKLKEEVNAYNKKIAEQELAYQKKRPDVLAALEKERETKQRELEAETAADEAANGYRGEKAEEMEKRYRLAYDAYANLDKDTALTLVNEQSEALKQTLGLYYQRLIEALTNR